MSHTFIFEEHRPSQGAQASRVQNLDCPVRVLHRLLYFSEFLSPTMDACSKR